MSRKKKPLPILENVTITDVAAEGKSLARVNDMVIFVPFTVPGDVVDIQIKKKRHSYCEGEAVRFIEYSKIREVPMCQHFGVCGGCKWQNLPYEEQLKAKQKQVYDQLKRIGKIELPDCMPILGSVKTKEYRNKLEFGFSNKRWMTKEEINDERLEIKDKNAVGFHITGAFDKILPIEKCWLMDDLHNRIRNEIRDYALEHNLSFFDLRAQTGLLRDLIIRNSNTGEWMVIMQFHLETSPCPSEGGENGRRGTSPGPSKGGENGRRGTSPSPSEGGENGRRGTSPSPNEGGENRWETEDGRKALALMQHIADNFPEITSLMYVDNQKCNDTIGDLDILTFKGNDYIYETMEDLKYKVGPKSFYQTNTEQAYHLYSVAREFAGLTGNELVYDLYTGTGTIANFVARQAKKVIGIEYVPEAIEDAKINSQVNNISNTLFYAGDMKDILNDDFIAEHGRPDVIITDPPRAGMHQDVIQTILRAAPKRIVYVSCNPATQARDLADLDCQYRVMAVQPVDMFPHTPHVENVVLLERRD